MLVSLVKDGCITKEVASRKMSVGLNEFEYMFLTAETK